MNKRKKTVALISSEYIGVRSIWYLWRNAKWSLLKQIDLSRKDLDTLFWNFEEKRARGAKYLDDREAAALLAIAHEDLREKIEHSASRLVLMYTLKPEVA